MRRLLSCVCVSLCLIAVGCGNDTRDPQPEPAQPREARDYCEVFGWYGDGHCDDICPEPDPDCSVGVSPGTPSTPSTPGGPTEPTPDPTEPICEVEVGWWRDYFAYGEECEQIDFDCDDGVPFQDECGCGCEEAQNGQCDYLYDLGEVEFVSQDPDFCARANFACSGNAESFDDPNCGCGCITPWDVGPLACLDDSKPDISRVGNVEECTLIDFDCGEGWINFYDDCGCGCRLACSDDFECPNGYCEVAVDDSETSHCVYPNCDDDSQVLCDALPPECNDGDVAAVVNGCYECLDARTCGPSQGP